MLTNKTLMEALDLVAERFPVHRWRVAGLWAWPLYRYEIATRNFYMFTATAASAHRARASVFRQRLARQWTDLRKLHSAGKSDGMNDSFGGQRDVVLYSDGVSFSRLGNRWYEKFCDPLIERLQQDLGQTTLMLTPLSQAQVPRHSRSIFVQPQIDAVLLGSAVTGRVLPLDVALEGYADAARFLESIHPKLTIPSPRFLYRAAHTTRACAALYERWLLRTRPKAVFVVAYYGAERSGMVLACKRLRIPSVDIQHGAISDVHFAYARVGERPIDGYETLPDWFWVWGEHERRLIEEWAGREPTPHRVVIGGNPFITMCTQARNPSLAEAARKIDRVREGTPEKRAVLYTANGYETDEVIVQLGRLVAETSSQVVWWFRMHPSRLEASERFRASFTAAGVHNYELELATESPLPVLMPRMSAHVTEGSSAATEAAVFGVPTVLWAAEGHQQFAHLIEAHEAFAARGLEDVSRVLGSTHRGSRPVAGGRDLELAALRTILDAQDWPARLKS